MGKKDINNDCPDHRMDIVDSDDKKINLRCGYCGKTQIFYKNDKYFVVKLLVIVGFIGLVSAFLYMFGAIFWTNFFA